MKKILMKKILMKKINVTKNCLATEKKLLFNT